MATKYLITNPVGVDKPIQALQILFDEISWIDTAYGRAFRNIRQNESGKDSYYPCVYIGADQYLECIPDNLTDGNSVFFISKNQRYLNATAFESEIGAVFFVNLAKAKPLAAHRAIEEVKADVLTKLVAKQQKEFVLVLDEIEALETFEDCYREYSYKEISQLASMHPFAIFRINFTINYNNC